MFYLVVSFRRSLIESYFSSVSSPAYPKTATSLHFTFRHGSGASRRPRAYDGFVIMYVMVHPSATTLYSPFFLATCMSFQSITVDNELSATPTHYILLSLSRHAPEQAMVLIPSIVFTSSLRYIPLSLSVACRQAPRCIFFLYPVGSSHCIWAGSDDRKRARRGTRRHSTEQSSNQTHNSSVQVAC